ncbi:MAG: methyltransferase [Wenzhouxiangellaceae bacterium]
MLSSLKNRSKDWRNRLIADPRFQRFAARYWPFRSVARRRAVQLFDLCAGFIYAQVLYACVQLELLPQLQAGEKSLHDLLPGSGLQPEALRRLLLAAVALDLLEQRATDRFALGPQGAAMLANPGIAAMVRHHRFLYQDLVDPLALLQGKQRPTRLQSFWRYALDNALHNELDIDMARNGDKDADKGSARDVDMDHAPAVGSSWAQTDDYQLYSELMASSQHMIAEQVLNAYNFSSHRALLDVGGGLGEFLRRVGQRYPGLQLGLFDLPPVIETARQGFAGDKLVPRCFAGNFQHDALPSGFDLISLVRVLHDHDDAVVQQLLERCAQALPPGGRLLIAEPLAATPGAKAMGDAYFGLYLFAMGQGRPRTFKEYQGFLQQAGFYRVRRVKTSIPMLCSLLIATVKKKV